MPNETKIDTTDSAATRQDSSQPVPPAIPGVAVKSTEEKKADSPVPRQSPVVRRPATARAVEPAAGRRETARNIGLSAVAGAGLLALLAGLIFYYTHTRQPRDTPSRAETTAVPDAAKELDTAADMTANLPVAPGVIARADELATPWSSKKFVFDDPLSQLKMTAMVVRLPRGEYWGFSLKAPFGSCDLELVTDLQRLQSFYGYGADHPMIGDPCNKAVFDLLQYGGPSNAEVRGMVVHGMGVRPPIAIEIEQKGNEISAVRMESE